MAYKGQKSKESKSSKRKILALEREVTALQMRKAGVTYRQIGEEIGITEMGAYKCVMRALKKIGDDIKEEAHDVLAIEMERLDRLWLSMYQQAIAGDKQATTQCIKIIDIRAKLMGLYAPTKHAVTNDTTLTIKNEQEARLKLLASIEQSREEAEKKL